MYLHFHLTFNTNSEEPSQTQRSVVSGLGMHCLPLSHIIKIPKYLNVTLA